MKMIANSSGNGIAGTIDSNYFKGTGTRRGHEREFVVMAACETDECEKEKSENICVSSNRNLQRIR